MSRYILSLLFMSHLRGLYFQVTYFQLTCCSQLLILAAAQLGQEIVHVLTFCLLQDTYF